MRWHPGRYPLSLAVIGMLVLAFLVVANLAAIEFGPLRTQAIAVDELYFAVCAARGNAIGEFPVFGCHDTKTPLIYATHQLVQYAAGLYSLVGIKVAAYCMIGIGAALIAWLTHRLGGLLGAVAAAALFLLTVGTDAFLFALKSEVLGSAFVLVGLLVLTLRRDAPVVRDWFLCGICFGLAFMVKQTFAFAVLAVLVVSFIAPARNTAASASRSGLSNVVAMSVGSAIPVLVFGLLFALQGRGAEYLASTFLYPGIYDSPAGESGLRRLLWRIGGVLQDMGRTPLVVMLAAFVLPTAFRRSSPQDTPQTAAKWQLQALVACTLGMLLVVFVSPIYFDYHLLPAWILLSVMGGLAVERAAVAVKFIGPPAAWGMALALLIPAAMMAAASWYSSGGKSKLVNRAPPQPTVTGAKGEYGYVLGMWPQFYFSSGLVPATTVLFPWALPGTPKNWAFVPPDPSTLKGRWLTAMQSLGSEQLMQDFAKTPPSYIVVSHEMARAAGSPRVTDVIALDDYLRDHCSYLRPVQPNLGSPQSLFGCNARRGGTPGEEGALPGSPSAPR